MNIPNQSRDVQRSILENKRVPHFPNTPHPISKNRGPYSSPRQKVNVFGVKRNPLSMLEISKDWPLTSAPVLQRGHSSLATTSRCQRKDLEVSEGSVP